MRYLGIIVILTIVLGVYLLHRYQTERGVSSAAEQAAKEVFLENVRSFADCLQPLYEAVEQGDHEETAAIMEELETRMSDFSALSSFMHKNGEQWLIQAEQWGVCHDRSGDEFEITPEDRKRYIFNDVFGEGARARVLRPAWYLREDGSCLQKGSAAILRGEKLYE